MARKPAGLGERHRKIMEFLTRFQNSNHYSPSIREIGESIGVTSTSLVDYYLKQLEEMQYIERDNHISRSIRILRSMTTIQDATAQAARTIQKKVEEFLSIPLAGRIVASAPIPVPSSDFAYFDPESSIEIARTLLPARENVSDLFALEVDGDSMIDAMINDGDIVVMRRASDAINGEMVAVWLDDTDETTLKYFYRENDRVRLQPANPTMKPIIVNNPERMRIMGKVVMVIRQVRSVAA